MHRERAEQNQEELRQLLVSKDRDMASKDTEGRECHRGAQISQAALDVARDNYAEIKSVVKPLVNNSEWLQWYGIAHVTNAVLNLVELDQTVVAFIVAARHMDHREGYTECASHVEAALKFKWDNSHCSTSAEVETIFEKTILALPIMDLVSDALQHDDYVTRLKSILKVHGDEDFGFDCDEDEEGVGEAV
ncbi:hypothetical protein Hanom_Chr08g00745051 [Helianthus anomalus]